MECTRPAPPAPRARRSHEVEAGAARGRLGGPSVRAPGPLTVLESWCIVGVAAHLRQAAQLACTQRPSSFVAILASRLARSAARVHPAGIVIRQLNACLPSAPVACTAGHRNSGVIVDRALAKLEPRQYFAEACGHQECTRLGHPPQDRSALVQPDGRDFSAIGHARGESRWRACECPACMRWHPRSSQVGGPPACRNHVLIP